MKKRRIKKWPFAILLLFICLVFGTLFIFKDQFVKKNEDTPSVLEKEDSNKEYSLTFTLGGNVLVNSYMWYDSSSSGGTYDFTHTFEDLNDIMKKSDINFYFQQSILGGRELGLSSNYDYNTPTEIIETLSNSEFNLISLGSYHAYDRGLSGIQNSIEELDERNIKYSGVSASASDRLSNNVISKNGVKVGLLSYTTNTDETVNEDYAVNIYSDELVKTDVESIKENVDVIMVSIDWSNISSSTTISDEQKRIASYLSSLGVNILVGNTSNVIQPIEMVDNMLVCYSLGNLLSGHYAVDSRISAMVDFNLKLTKSNDETSFEFDNINVLLTYAYNSSNTGYKVIPFTKVSTYLTNYNTYYDKYSQLLANDNNNINIYPMGE